MSEEQLYDDRFRKLDAIRALGQDPYGARFDGVVANAKLRSEAEALNLEPGATSERTVRVAGRITLQRVMGKLAFLQLRDSSGDIQIGISRGSVSDETWGLVKLLDLGDWLGVDGAVGQTKTGELTVWASALTMLCKSLRPPPAKWHGLTDVDLRYRHRYLDLAANPDVMKTFLARFRMIDAMRSYLRGMDFVEVETPMLQPVYGGAAAKPFVTHHNALDIDLYMRISPELYHKRLLVGGMDRVFEINRNFRNEGISTRHNPEFTMMELYQAYGDYHSMMEIVEGMFSAAIATLDGEFKRPYGEKTFDYSPPWRRATYGDLMNEHAGIDMTDGNAVTAKAEELGILARMRRDKRNAALFDESGKPVGIHRSLLVNEIFEEMVEPHLHGPMFVMDYPAELCPLTRRKADDPSLALRFEAYVGGMEIANAYTELNDSVIQRETFSAQLDGEGDETMRVMDEDFLMAMEHGMPPAGGLGVGIDRMVMLLTNAPSIRDVILFPVQRPLPADPA